MRDKEDRAKLGEKEGKENGVAHPRTTQNGKRKGKKKERKEKGVGSWIGPTRWAITWAC